MNGSTSAFFNWTAKSITVVFALLNGSQHTYAWRVYGKPLWFKYGSLRITVFHFPSFPQPGFGNKTISYITQSFVVRLIKEIK